MFDGEADFVRALQGFRPTSVDLEPGFSQSESDSLNVGTVSRAEVNPPLRNGKPRQQVVIGPYFQMPYRLFSSGLGARLGPSAGWLYTYLCSYANDCQSMTFSISGKTMACDAGMSTRTIVEAKKILKALGLIEFSPKPGSKDQYTLKKPDLERMKRQERPREKLKPRGKAKSGYDPWNGLPQILRGTHANYAQPYAKFADPHRCFKEG